MVEEETASAETPAATAWSSASGKAFGHATVDALSSVPSQPLASGSHMKQEAIHGGVGQVKEEMCTQPRSTSSSLGGPSDHQATKHGTRSGPSYAPCRTQDESESQNGQLGLGDATYLDQKPVECDRKPVTEDLEREMTTALTGSPTTQRRNVHVGTATDVLSDEQRAILDRVLRGQSVFFTGSAGTGKTAVIRAIAEVFAERRFPFDCRTCIERTLESASLETMGPADSKDDIRVRHRGSDEATRWGEGDHRCIARAEDTRWILGVTASTGFAAR